MVLQKIITGGQTGVDRAALDVCLALKIPCGGWCPRGRLAEDGPIDLRYPLLETPLADTAQRTEWNVRDGDGTLILSWGLPSGGTALTVNFAKQGKKPHLILDLSQKPSTDEAFRWLEGHAIRVLNVGALLEYPA